MKQLTDILHLLMCQKPHESDMMKLADRHTQRCYYYLESDVAGGEEFPDHLEWDQISANFQTSLGFDSPESAYAFIQEAIGLSQEVRKLTYGNKLKVDFIMSLLK